MTYKVPIYNPNDIEGNTLREILSQPRRPMNTAVDCEALAGGIYLIYYEGLYPTYKNLLREDPIYIGSSTLLGKRLRTHLSTLEDVNNLDSKDFYFRCLGLPTGDEKKYEDLLIKQYQPVWNISMKGFGCDGVRRTGGKASSWDQMHPGRKRAEKLERPPEMIRQIREANIRRQLEEDDVFSLFYI